MTTLEILALIMAGLITIKLITFMIKPGYTSKMSEIVSKNSSLFTVVYLVLAVVIGIFLFQHIGVIEIAAVMLFTGTIVGAILLQYPELLLKMGNDLTSGERKELWKKNWLLLLSVAILASGVFYELILSIPE